jgi:hypothetical protein
MNDTAQELTNLQQEVETAQQNANKAKGAYEQVLKQIKDQFKCKTLEQAEQELKRLRGEEVKAKRKYEKEMAKFKEKWKDQLEDEEEDE